MSPRLGSRICTVVEQDVAMCWLWCSIAVGDACLQGDGCYSSRIPLCRDTWQGWGLLCFLTAPCIVAAFCPAPRPEYVGAG